MTTANYKSIANKLKFEGRAFINGKYVDAIDGQKFENIKHCFFSRKRGISQGIYEGLNCGLGSDDNKENVLKNLELVAKKITCSKESLITLNQKHTNQVIHFDSERSVKNKLTYG